MPVARSSSSPSAPAPAAAAAWFDTYNVTGGGATRSSRSTTTFPAVRPRPEAIIYGVALALGLVDKKAAPVELKQVEFPIDTYERNKAWEKRNVIYELLK